MLKMMRKNTTSRNVIAGIVIAALAAYVFVSFGTSSPLAQGDTVVRLGSANIQVLDAMMAKENLRELAANLPRETVDQLTTTRLMSQAVMIDGANKADLYVSDEELRDLVITYRTQPDGSFVSDQQWADFIRYRYQVQVETYEEYLRTRALLTQKFGSLFTNSVFVSEEEVKAKFLEDNQRINLNMLVLNTYDVRANVQITDDGKLKTFYDEHQDQFKSGELRQIRYIQLPLADYKAGIEISDEEAQANYQDKREQRYKQEERVRANHVLIKTENRSEEEALKKAREIQAEIAGGLAFTEAAKTYSEDDSNKDRGGDLGYFNRARMVEPFADAAFTMETGTISEPVKTRFGYHLIQKTDHQQAGYRPFEEVKTQIVNEITNNRAKEKVKDLLQAFAAKVQGGADFEKQAQAMGYTVRTSEFFDQDNQSFLGPTLGRDFQVRRATFQLEELNDVSDVLDSGQKAAVIQWTAEKEPEIIPFEENKIRIRTHAEKIGGREFILDFFATVQEQINQNPDRTMADFTNDWDFLKDNHFRETGFISASSLPFELRQLNLDFEKDLYAMEKGAFLNQHGAEDATRFVLARMVDKEEADMAQLEEERAAITEQIRNEKGNDLLTSYIYQQTKRLDPNDRVRAVIAQTVKDSR